MNKSFFIVTGVFILTAITLNYLIKNPVFKNHEEQAKFYLKINQPDEAEKCYLKLIQTDSFNIDYHHQYIINHFNIPKLIRQGKSNFVSRNDQKIYDYYYQKTLLDNTVQNDIGYYGMGLIDSYADHNSNAINNFNNVSNPSLKYLNNSMGYIYKESHHYNSAVRYFYIEIENKGNLDGAYNNIAEICIEIRKTAFLQKYMSDSAIHKYITYNNSRVAYYLLGMPSGYIKTVLKRFTGNVNSSGFLGAFIILVCWLFFLQQIDIYEKEKWIYLLLTCCMGMLFTFGTFIITDFLNESLQFKLNGNLLNDFFYCVFGIGSVEELLKFIPVIIMMKFSKQINEPIDYIIYASASALGFAFIENLMYFNESSLYLIHIRALSAVITHMFNSSLIAYGIILWRYKNGGDKYAYLLFAYLIASASHGFYDFWLLSDSVNSLSIVTIVFMLFTFIMYNTFISNALNNSSYYDYKNRRND